MLNLRHFDTEGLDLDLDLYIAGAIFATVIFATELGEHNAKEKCVL